MGANVLVVEDEPALAEFVGFTLQREGHQVRRTADGEDALRVFGMWQPQLVVLDLVLPGLDGLEVCRHIRRRGSVPILITSAKDTEIDKVIGLEMGADDYLAKPFGPRELVARVKSLLRRSACGAAPPVGTEELVLGRVRLDLEQHKAFVGDQELGLTLKQEGMLA